MMSSLIYYLVFFFFFFKQKTAYEMRISDWSSDVCSSDLRNLNGGQGRRVEGAGRQACHWICRDGLQLRALGIGDVAVAIERESAVAGVLGVARQRVDDSEEAFAVHCNVKRVAGLLDRAEGEVLRDLGDEIGRASCRERECQYV